MLVLKGRRNGGDLLALGPDGQTLAARCETGLQLWRGLTTGARPLLKDLEVGWLEFAPTGDRLYLDGPSSGIYDLRSDVFTPIPQSDAGYRFLALSPSGEQMLAAHVPSDKPCRIESWSTAEPGKPLWSVTLTRHCLRPLFLSDDHFAIVESSQGSYAYVIHSATTGAEIGQSPPLAWFPDWDAVSPDGKWIAGAKGRRISVRSVTKLGEPVEWQNDTRKDFTDLAFHPSGRYLAATNNDETVKFYDTTTWKVAHTFIWQIGKMRSIAFSPDGTLAAAGGDKGQVVVWDLDL